MWVWITTSAEAMCLRSEMVGRMCDWHLGLEPLAPLALAPPSEEVWGRERGGGGGQRASDSCTCLHAQHGACTSCPLKVRTQGWRHTGSKRDTCAGALQKRSSSCLRWTGQDPPQQMPSSAHVASVVLQGSARDGHARCALTTRHSSICASKDGATGPSLGTLQQAHALQEMLCGMRSRKGWVRDEEGPRGEGAKEMQEGEAQDLHILGGLPSQVLE